MGLGALTLAWIAVEAALPLAWKFMSLVRGEDDEWTATARGPQPDREGDRGCRDGDSWASASTRRRRQDLTDPRQHRNVEGSSDTLARIRFSSSFVNRSMSR